jgi:UrcA family protein
MNSNDCQRFYEEIAMNSFRLNTKTRFLVGVLASLSLVAGLASRAAEATTTVSRQVSAAGIDLNTPEGANVMYFRLKTAARALCSTSDPVEKAPSWVYRACMQEALAKVVRDAHRPYLTQAFVSDYGGEIAAHFGVDTYLAKK